MRKKVKLGLALGGGGARGLSHIGVLAAFEDAGLPVDVISGTSMGAIIGAMYAVEPDAKKVRERFLAYLESEPFKDAGFDFMREKDDAGGEGIFYRFSHFARRGLFYTMSLARRSFVLDDTAAANFAFLVPEARFEDLKIPLVVSALDLISGTEYLFKSGDISPAVAASCSIPGILPPVEFEEKILVDGGWVNAIPIVPARELGADIVIGVDVNRELGSFDQAANALDIVFRSDLITRFTLANERLKTADLVLEPENSISHWADFSQAEEAIRAGRDAAEEKITEIRKLLRRKKRRRFFGMGS